MQMFICPLWIEMTQPMFLISYYNKFVMLQEKFRHKHTKKCSGFTTKITMFLKNWNWKKCKHVLTVLQCSYTWMLIMKSSVFVHEVSGIWQVHIAAVCILDHIFCDYSLKNKLQFNICEIWQIKLDTNVCERAKYFLTINCK